MQIKMFTNSVLLILIYIYIYYYFYSRLIYSCYIELSFIYYHGIQKSLFGQAPVDWWRSGGIRLFFSSLIVGGGDDKPAS